MPLPGFISGQEKLGQRISRERKVFTSKAREQITTLLLGGFSFVAALAWNDAVQTLFQNLFGGKPNSLVAKFGYAILITLVVVFVSLNLGRFFRDREGDEENK